MEVEEAVSKTILRQLGQTEEEVLLGLFGDQEDLIRRQIQPMAPELQQQF
jgi:hypothetical protein